MNEQRKQLYNDQKLQGYLLAGLVILEFMLVLSLLFYLFAEINAILESHLYRFHNTQTASWPEILSLLATTISGFLLVNIAALYFAHLIWGRYVKHTINLFSDGLDKIIALDFSGRLPSSSGHHRIIDLLKAWYAKEQQRNRAIGKQIERLTGFTDRSLGPLEQEELQNILEDYRRLLTQRQ